MIRFLLLTIAALLVANCSVLAQEVDPFDPLATPELSDGGEKDPDADKTAQELLMEALVLQQDEHLLDSRSKLLKALKKNPKDYRIHMTLAAYYMQHVGHFRLALKYSKQAERLFYEQAGQPPYHRDSNAALIHADLLMLMSQARLNLDDYQGSLEKLNEFEQAGYFSASYPSSKAWVLMKMGRLNEAITTARAGLMAGANPGHTLNILGILLSITGERQSSLQTFQEALRYELSLGTYGNPATPLNNSGEVYREIFSEKDAKKNWLRAIQLPDGCEHVLPSLNLAIVNIDELQIHEAKKAIDSFEACFAQFPLRNGEEHKALVHMARGRIALHSGHIDEALEHLQKAGARQQWFGKIGTNVEDLKVAVYSSLSFALGVKNNHLASTYYSSWVQWLDSLQQRVTNSLRRIWIDRRTRAIMTEDLNYIEDLYIRHTDSMIEYPSLGALLSTFPKSVITRRIEEFKKNDNRGPAELYYNSYIAESMLASGDEDQALSLIESILQKLREQDALLRSHLLGLKLSILGEGSDFRYAKTAYELYVLDPTRIRNAGAVLPVNFSALPDEIVSALSKTSLLPSNRQKLPIQVQYTQNESVHVLKFVSELKSVGNISVKASSLEEVVNKFVDSIFSRNI